MRIPMAEFDVTIVNGQLREWNCMAKMGMEPNSNQTRIPVQILKIRIAAMISKNPSFTRIQFLSSQWHRIHTLTIFSTAQLTRVFFLVECDLSLIFNCRLCTLRKRLNTGANPRECEEIYIYHIRAFMWNKPYCRNTTRIFRNQPLINAVNRQTLEVPDVQDRT